MKNIRKLTLTEWFVCLLIVGVCFYPQIAKALEFQVDKNAAFNFTAPLINATNTSIFASGCNNTAFYIHSNDNTTFAAAATNITAINGSGVYLWQLNASEMNHNRVGVYYNGTGALQQYFVINTVPKEQIDTRGTGNLTTADLAGLTNVTLAATQTGVTIPTVTTLTGHTPQTGDSYAIVNSATFGNSALKTSLGNGTVVAASVTGAVGSVTGNVTVTNCDVATSTRGTGNLTTADLAALTNVTLAGTQTYNNTGTWTGNVSAVTGPVGSISGVTFPGNFSAMNITSDGNVTTAASGGLTAQNVWEYDNRTLTSAGAGGATAQEVWEYGGSRNVTVTGGTITSVTNPVGISAGNITTATFAAGAIDANAIAANAIGASEIADDAIDAGAIAANAIGASEIGTGAIDADAIATDAIGAAEVAADAGTEIGTAVWATTTRQLTGTQAFNVTGNVLGNVSSVTNGVIVTTNNDKTGYALTQAFPGNFSSMLINSAGNVTANPGAGGATAQQVWEYNTTAIDTAGLAGTRLNAAGSAGDPWSTEIPGSYTGSQAGYYLQDLVKKSRGR